MEAAADGDSPKAALAALIMDNVPDYEECSAAPWRARVARAREPRPRARRRVLPLLFDGDDDDRDSAVVAAAPVVVLRAARAASAI